MSLPDLPEGFSTVFEAGELTLEMATLAAAHTFVTIIGPRALLIPGGNSVHLLGQGTRGDVTCPVDNTYIGPLSASGHAWNFSAVTAYTWDGGATVTFQSDPYPGDAVAFSFTNAYGLAIASNVASGARVAFIGDLGDDVMTFYKSGVSQASSTGKDSDYSGPLRGVMAIYNRIAASQQ